MLRKGIIILLFVQVVIFSQFENDTNYIPQKETMFGTFKSDIASSFDTGLELLKSPYYFDKNDLIMTGIIVSLTSASFSLDNKLRNETFFSHSKTMDRITNFGENFGNGSYGVILSGLLYSTGLIFSDRQTRETGQMLAEAMIVNGLYTQLLKISLGRARPYTGEPNTEIDPFEFEFESAENSLPSGHTSTAFTIATVLSERIDNFYASIALYSLASLSAYQRVYADVHWLSDTILGAALGTFIGLKIVKLHEDKLSEDKSYSLNVFPKISSSSYGVGFTLEF